ncbi:MAG: hypothetical protein PGN13_16030 [Patulibacter minatonensis]
MSRPTVSPCAERIYDRLDAYSGADAPVALSDEANGWILLHLCEAYARTLAKPTELLRHDERGSGWRRAYDPDRAAVWLLAWIAQHTGGTVPVQITDEKLRALVRDAPHLRRGSLQALIAAGRSELTDPSTGLLHVLEFDDSTMPPDADPDDAAYYLTVAGYTSQITSADELEAALLTQKAIGLVLTVAVEPGWVVGVLETAPAYPTVGDLEDAFATVALLEDHIE